MWSCGENLVNGGPSPGFVHFTTQGMFPHVMDWQLMLFVDFCKSDHVLFMLVSNKLAELCTFMMSQGNSSAKIKTPQFPIRLVDLSLSCVIWSKDLWTHCTNI